MGEGMIVNFDGVPLVTGGGRPDEIITAEVRPDLVREARRQWGVENNIYQLGHRGYVAVKGGAGDCPYTYMRDLGRGPLPPALGGRGRRASTAPRAASRRPRAATSRGPRPRLKPRRGSRSRQWRRRRQSLRPRQRHAPTCARRAAPSCAPAGCSGTGRVAPSVLTSRPHPRRLTRTRPVRGDATAWPATRTRRWSGVSRCAPCRRSQRPARRSACRRRCRPSRGRGAGRWGS